VQDGCDRRRKTLAGKADVKNLLGCRADKARVLLFNLIDFVCRKPLAQLIECTDLGQGFDLAFGAQVIAFAMRSKADRVDDKEARPPGVPDLVYDIFDVFNEIWIVVGEPVRPEPKSFTPCKHRASQGRVGGSGLRDPVVFNSK